MRSKQKRQKRQAHSTSFASSSGCADLAPASWSAAVPLPLWIAASSTEGNEGERGGLGTGFLQEATEVTELDRRKPHLFASFPLFASVQDCDVGAKDRINRINRISSAQRFGLECFFVFSKNPLNHVNHVNQTKAPEKTGALKSFASPNASPNFLPILTVV